MRHPFATTMTRLWAPTLLAFLTQACGDQALGPDRDPSRKVATIGICLKNNRCDVCESPERIILNRKERPLPVATWNVSYDNTCRARVSAVSVAAFKKGSRRESPFGGDSFSGQQ